MPSFSSSLQATTSCFNLTKSSLQTCGKPAANPQPSRPPFRSSTFWAWICERKTSASMKRAITGAVSSRSCLTLASTESPHRKKIGFHWVWFTKFSIRASMSARSCSASDSSQRSDVSWRLQMTNWLSVLKLSGYHQEAWGSNCPVSGILGCGKWHGDHNSPTSTIISGNKSVTIPPVLNAECKFTRIFVSTCGFWSFLRDRCYVTISFCSCDFSF